MKKSVFLLLTLLFLFNYKTASAEDTCIPNNHPEILNTKDYILEIGQEIPNYLVGVYALDSCGVELPILNIRAVDDYINYNQEGEYPLYFYLQQTVLIKKVKIYTDIPKIYGLNDLRIQINTNNYNFLDGITAMDVINNVDITGSIEVDYANVDFTNVGEYIVTYSVLDNEGNQTIKNISVFVEDTISPVIENCVDLTLEVHTNLSEYNFWANINVNDNSNKEIIKTMNFENINISVLGDYVIEYVAIDEENNETRVPINVKVVDTTKPEFINLLNLSININDKIKDIDFLDGVEVRDNYDGIIDNSKVLIFKNEVKEGKAGVYNVYYFVSDSSGNYITSNIIVAIIDNNKPEIHNANDIYLPVNPSEYNFYANVTATDSTDGIITYKMMIFDDLVDVTKVGTYKLFYVVYDSSGNCDIKEINVIIYDTEKPLILGVKDLNIEVNQEYTKEFFLQGITATDNSDGDITNYLDVDISGINFSLLGTYEIKYFVTDSNDNMAEIMINVSVVDTTKPVITNALDKTVKKGEEIDLLAGVNVSDNYDSQLELKIKGYYNFNVPGEYKLKIEVYDSSGNYSFVHFTLIVTDEKTDNFIKTDNFTMYYIIGVIGVSLVLTGVLGYNNRKKRRRIKKIDN